MLDRRKNVVYTMLNVLSKEARNDMENRVKEAREALGMSQVELARRSGVSRATIWAVESKKNYSMTTKKMMAIAEAMNEEVQNIFFTRSA